MFGTKKKPALNLLELVPKHARAYDVADDGTVTVRVPRFKYDWMSRHLLPRRRNPHIHTRLDAYGSFVWLRIDGVRTVAEIGEELDAHFGEDVRPVYDRLGLFVRAMRDRTFIVLHHADGTPV